jgi:ABC-2 type transport system permease protein
LLLSGIFLPLSLAPQSLQTIAAFNPFAYTVNAARILFTGATGNTTVIEGFLVTGVLALLALIWVTRSFQRATA